MSESVDDFNIIPLRLSLFHLATVKVALQLWKYCHIDTINKAFAEIQNGQSAALNEGSQEKKYILSIPPYLRRAVLRAVNGITDSSRLWHRQHSEILDMEDKHKIIIYIGSDGRIERIKTAEQLVKNLNIHIRKRFRIAAMYCFEEIMQKLWTEMEASEKTKCLNADASLSHFAIRWLSDGCRVPFSQAPLQYRGFRDLVFPPIPRFSSFFPSLQPNYRDRHLNLLIQSTLDDILFCLRTVTKEEEDKFLSWHATDFLILYLQFPMQSLFLETAKKIWHYISNKDFVILLIIILEFQKENKDFDYGVLFDGLWIRGSNHFRESAQQCKRLREAIDCYMNQRKRKSDSEGEQIQKLIKFDSDSNGSKK